MIGMYIRILPLFVNHLCTLHTVLRRPRHARKTAPRGPSQSSSRTWKRNCRPTCNIVLSTGVQPTNPCTGHFYPSIPNTCHLQQQKRNLIILNHLKPVIHKKSTIFQFNFIPRHKHTLHRILVSYKKYPL